MNVHRVNESVVRSDEPNFQRLTDAHGDRFSCGVRAAVDCEVVRLRAIHWHRGERQSFALQPFLQKHDGFMIRVDARVGNRRIDDHRAVQTEGLLTIDVIMRVIEISAVLDGGEFVVIRAAVPDRVLRHVRRAIHHVRQNETVPVNRRAFGQAIRDIDAHAIAATEAKRRAWYLSVECVSIDGDARQDRPANRRCFEIEYLHTILDTRRERPRTALGDVVH